MTIRQSVKRRKTNRTRMDAIRSFRPLGEAEHNALDVTSVADGHFIAIEGIRYLVEGVSRYREHNWKFSKPKEFEGTELDLLEISTGNRTSLEWGVDDKVEVSLTLREISISDVSDAIGNTLRGSRCGGIIDEEESVRYGGNEYHYDDDWAAKYYRDGEGEGVNVRFYEFASSGGEELSVEEWFDGDPKDGDTEVEYDVFISRPVDPASIEVLGIRVDAV